MHYSSRFEKCASFFSTSVRTRENAGGGTRWMLRMVLEETSRDRSPVIGIFALKSEVPLQC